MSNLLDTLTRVNSAAFAFTLSISDIWLLISLFRKVRLKTVYTQTFIFTGSKWCVNIFYFKKKKNVLTMVGLSRSANILETSNLEHIKKKYNRNLQVTKRILNEV